MEDLPAKKQKTERHSHNIRRISIANGRQVTGYSLKDYPHEYRKQKPFKRITL